MIMPQMELLASICFQARHLSSFQIIIQILSLLKSLMANQHLQIQCTLETLLYYLRVTTWLETDNCFDGLTMVNHNSWSYLPMSSYVIDDFQCSACNTIVVHTANIQKHKNKKISINFGIIKIQWLKGYMVIYVDNHPTQICERY